MSDNQVKLTGVKPTLEGEQHGHAKVGISVDQSEPSASV